MKKPAVLRTVSSTPNSRINWRSRRSVNFMTVSMYAHCTTVTSKASSAVPLLKSHSL
jgi:hypothetical protein